MKKLQMLYITAFFAACLVPSLGMAVTKQEASSENRRLAEFPELKKENEINTRWLPEAGEYFQEHFAFRNELVTANALLNGKIFGVSTADGVIQGTDNWLYYKDSLEDYLGEELLSERTSMSTPLVSGGIACLLEKDPRLSNVEVKMLLRENAEDMGLPRNQQGWGKFNCEKLLAG